jgi:hypothetical protein
MGKFYKQINGEWVEATNIYNKEYSLLSKYKDTYELPIDGWNWYDISPISKTEFELWGNRLLAITELKNQAKDSLLLIPISDFYDSNINDISEFIKTGSDTFLTTCRNSKEVWLDYRTDELSDSPREVLISTLEPLVITTPS